MAADNSLALLHLVPEAPSWTAPELLAAGIDAAFQPIVHLGSGSVIAYEALARPRHPEARNPLMFFDALERGGLRLAGERTAFEAAMLGAQAGLPKTKLFINASPNTLVDPTFDVDELIDLAHRHELDVSDLVIEVTESEEIDDIDELALRVQRLRRLGIGVAVDDAGAGHASFRVITRLRPTFIKLDRDLVTGVDTDGARYAFIEAMVRFARQIGSRLIAEGIETREELGCLTGLGVEAGQGYFLARPEIGVFSEPSPASSDMIEAAARRLRLGSAQVSVSELTRPASHIRPTETVADAYQRFAADPGLALILVEEGNRFIGQVSRRELDRALAVPGGWDQLAGQRIDAITDHDPLTLTDELDVVEAAAALAARPVGSDAEEVVVVDGGGRVRGVMAVRSVLQALTQVRGQRRDELHPLSGLPGATWVDGEIARRIAAGQQTSVVVLDVDGFRALNHYGGFALGDDAIRALARCLTGVTGGVEGAAVAHAGGDDFMLVVPSRGLEELLADTVRSVEGEVIPLLRTELRLRGVGDVADSLSLSMAAVEVVPVPASGHLPLDQVRQELADLLARAKRLPGFSAVRATGGELLATTWEPRPGHRTIALGLAGPREVRRTIDLIGRSWAAWWDVDERDRLPSRQVFPGPRPLVENLLEIYGGQLMAQVAQAEAAGLDVMEVAIFGPEQELLEVLDRLALVADAIHDASPTPASPEIALLDRLLRQRARQIVRRDVTVESACTAG